MGRPRKIGEDDGEVSASPQPPITSSVPAYVEGAGVSREKRYIVKFSGTGRMEIAGIYFDANNREAAVPESVVGKFRNFPKAFQVVEVLIPQKSEG